MKKLDNLCQSQIQEHKQIIKNNPKKMFGVLGLNNIQDEEGTSAYLFAKDMQKNKPYGLNNLFQNLHQDHDKNKKSFYTLLN